MLSIGGRGAQDADLFVLRRIADANVEEKAVELCFGERVRAFLLDRILRGEHEERFGEIHRLAGGGDVALLHGLEQRGLRARRCAVDLVREDDVREDRTAHEAKATCAGRGVFFHDLGAGDVARHEIGGELDAAEIESHGIRDRANHECLREPRHADEQCVSAAEHGHQDFFDHAFLADDALGDFGAKARRGGEENLALR